MAEGASWLGERAAGGVAACVRMGGKGDSAAEPMEDAELWCEIAGAAP